jgi:FO synthase
MSVDGSTPRPRPQQSPATAPEPPQAPAPGGPSRSALRRALARARDGKTLDQGEAAILLEARGGQLSELLGHASRTRDAGLARAGRARVIT